MAGAVKSTTRGTDEVGLLYHAWLGFLPDFYFIFYLFLLMLAALNLSERMVSIGFWIGLHDTIDASFQLSWQKALTEDISHSVYFYSFGSVRKEVQGYSPFIVFSIASPASWQGHHRCLESIWNTSKTIRHLLGCYSLSSTPHHDNDLLSHPVLGLCPDDWASHCQPQVMSAWCGVQAKEQQPDKCRNVSDVFQMLSRHRLLRCQEAGLAVGKLAVEVWS